MQNEERRGGIKYLYYHDNACAKGGLSGYWCYADQTSHMGVFRAKAYFLAAWSKGKQR